MSQSEERRVAVLLSSKTQSKENRELLAELLENPLDWDYLFHALARHKTIFIAWENLLRWDLIKRATRCSGLMDFWHVFYWQLHHANMARSRIYVDTAAHVLAELERNEVPCAVIKGGALIGDVYTTGERFLHDIDFLIPRSVASRCIQVMTALGYEYGVYNYATGIIEPMERRVERAWVFQMHNLPSFYKLSPEPEVPYLKFQAGWDFFDPFEDYSIPSGDVLSRRVPKCDGSGLYVPDRADQCLNACAHIFREGVSTVYNDYKINWQLSKMVDLVELLTILATSNSDVRGFRDRVAHYRVDVPVGYALECCRKVFGAGAVGDWADEYKVDESILSELRDGQRRFRAEGTVMDRVFAEGKIRSVARGGWSGQFSKDQY